MKQLLSTTVLLTVLSACGVGSGDGAGGIGGGGGGGTTFTGFSQLPNNGVTQLQGRAISSSYTTDSSFNPISIAPISGPSDAYANVTTENGVLVALSANAPTSSVTFDTRNGDTIVAESPLIGAATANGQDLAVFADPDAAGYEYQTFGAWLTGYETGSGTLGAGSYGLRTDPASMPSGTSATYNGNGIGVARLADGEPYATVSNVSVTTDFSTATITSSNTQAVNINTTTTSSASELDYSGTGTVSGSGFTASISGPATSGSAEGIFYGPTANEVGGTYQASGDGGVIQAGSFGGN
jgi:hypothetical protein